jgi:hypothetical protein
MAPSPHSKPANYTSADDAAIALDSRYDVGNAYQGRDAGMRKFDRALTELTTAINTLREDQDGMRISPDLEISVIEGAKKVQQWLLGDLRKPEPTNQFKALIGDGPEAQRAVDALLSGAERFSRRDQRLLVMPNPAQFQNPQHLDALATAIDKLRGSAPSLAASQMDHETSSLKSLLNDLSGPNVAQFFKGLNSRLDHASDILGKQQDSDGVTPLDQFSHHVAVETIARPALTKALESLRETAPLAEIGQQINQLPDRTARHKLAVQAVTALMYPDNDLDDALASNPGGRIILPGSAKGVAAAAAGVLITDNINAELSAATSLQKVLQDPKLADHIAAFATDHAALKARIGASFHKGETPDGSLHVALDDKGAPQIELTERAELKRMVVVRETVATWLEGKADTDTTAATIIAATKPAEQNALIHQTYGKALGDGYAGTRDWQNPVNQLAMNIEISVKAHNLVDLASLAARKPDALADAVHIGLSNADVAALEDRTTVTNLIDRFPETAAKLNAALAVNLRKPDFAAMGITLPKPSAGKPAPGNAPPKHIIPGR